jgi:hypothetical protein
MVYWKMLFLLRHVSVQSNHLQVIYDTYDFTKIIIPTTDPLLLVFCFYIRYLVTFGF